MNVVRHTLEGTSTEFEFTNKACKFLVKNFTSGDILVNYEAITNDNQDTSIKIPKQTAQVIFTDEKYPTKTNKIYVLGTGEVEVQMLCQWE